MLGPYAPTQKVIVKIRSDQKCDKYSGIDGLTYQSLS